MHWLAFGHCNKISNMNNLKEKEDLFGLTVSEVGKLFPLF